MKTRTSQFKEKIKEFGRQIDSVITYEDDGVTVELGGEELNSITPHYEGAVLKSVMKQLDIDSNVEIPIGTVLTYEFGVKVRDDVVLDYRGNYDYISYGNYIVKDVEKQEDTRSYKITCYDKMLYAMKEYESTSARYPLSVRDYLLAICEKIGLEFVGGQFANYDKIIPNELYLDSDGRSMNYTFRDVLDEIAEVTGGTICINADDKLEIRYIHDVGEITNVSNSSIEITDSEEAELSSFEIEGKTEQASTPTPDNPSELVSVGYENLNFTPYTNGTSKTTNGITFTVNSDGEIIANGTATATAYFYCHTHDLQPFWNLPKDKYIISGCPAGGSNTTYQMGFRLYNNMTQVLNVVDNGSGIMLDTNSYTYNRIMLFIAIFSGQVCDNLTFKPIVTKGTQAHTYIPYNKYGIEVKTTGKNIWNEEWENGYYNRTSGAKGSGNNYIRSADYIPITPNTSIYFNKPSDFVNYAVLFYDSSLTKLGGTTATNTTSQSFTSPSNASYFTFYGDTGLSNATYQNNIIITKGTQATTYEPYKSNTQLYILDNPLRSIGNVKDKLYIQNGYLYVERNIGKVVLNGSENWQERQNYTYADRFVANGDYGSPHVGYSNYFKIKNNTDNTYPYLDTNTNQTVVNFSEYGTTTLEQFKTWLSTHNTEVNYILATPTTEELGTANVVSTYDGITYINITDANTPTMNISYISQFEEIDEEYLKDVNVNFGDKFGPINTLVLSRGGDGDKIPLSIPSDLADDDKIAIQITDNQIMNDNNRDEYMSDILNKLYGLEYYINDFLSTGICYLDLCDRYRVKIGDTSYECIMFNDEVNITQGLQESIYTDMQEENQQEYKYMSSNDRGITQANIIAKKNEGVIEEYTQRLDDTNNRIDSVITTQTATDRRIDVISQNVTYTYDSQGNPETSKINAVETTTGFTFDKDGMKISSSDNTFTATIDEQGVFFDDGTSRVAEYTKDGSKQKDLQLFGVYYYGMKDMNDTPMFVAQLYTDDDGEECIGHFWNSGDY